MNGKPRHSVSVAAVVTDDDNHVLVVQRRDNGKWEIPGGILELDEPIHDGLRREVKEETGLDIEPDRLTGVYKNTRLNVIALVFRSQLIGGTAAPTEESRKVEWWSIDQIKDHMAEIFTIRVGSTGKNGAPGYSLHRRRRSPTSQ